MSTDELQRELHRIADGAPVADVPHDTWRQARRSVIRDRTVSIAAAAAVVGIVAVGVTWLPQQIRPPVAKTESGAVPAKIWTLRYNQDLPVEHDLSLGAASAAYLADEGDSHTVEEHSRVVIVTARDGAYHVVDLPDRARVELAPMAPIGDLALSPDGDQLAYTYELDEGTKLPAKGIAFVDLQTGQIRRVELAAAARKHNEVDYPSVWVRTMTWSPDGTYLVWGGQKMGLGVGGPSTAGLIGPDGAATAMPDEDEEDLSPTYAPGDDGTVMILGRTTTLTWRDGQVVSSQPADDSSSPWTAELREGVVSQVRSPYLGDDTGDRSFFLRGDVVATMPEWILSAPAVSALGWTPGGSLLLLRNTPGEKTVDQNVYEVQLDPDGAVTASKVVRFEPGQPPEGLTLATNLPVEDLPTPRWAQHRAPLYIGLGIAGGALLLTATWWCGRWWRRRQSMLRAARYESWARTDHSAALHRD